MSPMPGTTGVIHEHPAESNTAEDLAGEIDVKGGKERGVSWRFMAVMVNSVLKIIKRKLFFVH